MSDITASFSRNRRALHRVRKFCISLTVLCLSILIIIPETAAKESSIANKSSVEKRLIRNLLHRYDKFGVVGRPVNDSKTKMNVKYGLALVQILDLDENRQVLRTNCWPRYEWYDSLLKWNPKDYSDIGQIRLFPDTFWTPDIKLFNFADERMKEHRSARVVVYANGRVMWIPQTLFKSTCNVHIEYFPFDTQVCILTFGSWTYDESQIELDFWVGDDIHAPPQPYIDFTDYVPSNEWKTDGEFDKNISVLNRTRQIKSKKTYRSQNFTDSHNNLVTKRYPVLNYYVRLHRNPSFYVFILVIPCILLSSLTLIVFWLPPESPAKMMLGMNIFVAFFVLMLLLAESTPSAVKSFPLIGAFFCLNMVMITISTFLATLVINIHFRGYRKGPLRPFLRRYVVNGLGRILMIRQYIPLPESPFKNQRRRPMMNKTSSLSGSKGRHSVHVPELKSNKFMMTDHNDTMERGDCHTASTYFPLNSNTSSRPAGAHPSGFSFVQATATHENFDPNYPYPRQSAFLPTTNTSAPNADFLSHSTSGRPPPAEEGVSGRSEKCGSETGSTKEGLDAEDSPIMMSSNSSLERDVRDIKRYIRMFVNKQKDAERENLICMEWRTLAATLDRLFFFLYILVLITTVIIAAPKDLSEQKKMNEPKKIEY